MVSVGERIIAITTQRAKTLTLTHNPQIKQLKTAHARNDREKNYATGSESILTYTLLGL